MRKFIAAAILTLVPFGGIAQNNSLKNDGRMWDTWTHMASGEIPTFVKAAYVQGVIEGLRTGSIRGYYQGRIDEKNDALEYLKPCLQKGPCSNIPVTTLVKTVNMNEVEAGADKVRNEYTAQGTSILDVVHQVDKFYADFRNTPVCMIIAVQESVRSLRGETLSETELNAERRGCNP